MTSMNKAWWTVGAIVWPLSSVRTNVNFEITFKSCSKRTKWARIWLFSRMGTNVKLKIATKSRTKRTVRTCIWLFSSMSSNMAPYSSEMLSGVRTTWTLMGLAGRDGVCISLCDGTNSCRCSCSLFVFLCQLHCFCTNALTITLYTHLWETPVLFMASRY